MYDFLNVKKKPFGNKPSKSYIAAKNARQRLRNRLTANRQMHHPSIIPRGVYSKFSNRGNKPEIKTLDTLFSGAYNGVYTPDSVPCQMLNTNAGTACVQALNLVQQGAGTSQRIGHKICMKSLRLRLRLGAGNNVDNALTTWDRLMVLYDRNPDGTYPAANVILSNITQANQTQTGNFMDNLNPNFFDRFVVLMDKLITLQPYDSGGAFGNSQIIGPTTNEQFIVDEYISCKNLETIYGNTVNNLQTANPMTIAYIQTGALYILSIGSDNAATAPYTWLGSARLRFKDT